MTLPEFVEIDGRIYELCVAPGPLHLDGKPCRCLVDHDEQQIRISDEVPEDYRAVILEKAVSAALGYAPASFRLIPLTGQIS